MVNGEAPAAENGKGGHPESLSATEEAPVEEEPTTARVDGSAPSDIGEVNWNDYANTFDSDLSFAHETPAADAPSQFDFISVQPGIAEQLAWQLSSFFRTE